MKNATLCLKQNIRKKKNLHIG